MKGILVVHLGVTKFSKIALILVAAQCFRSKTFLCCIFVATLVKYLIKISLIMYFLLIIYPVNFLGKAFSS